MAEGGGLLNRYTAITRIVGSNPIPSAIMAFAGVHGRLVTRYRALKISVLVSCTVHGGPP